MSEGTDWAWCYENPKEAASLIDALEADRNAYKAQANLFKHMVITCGVAATHSDANLTRTGSYAERWNSQQAEQVRALRADRDALRKALESIINIEDRYTGGDWDEIAEARQIAYAAIAVAPQPKGGWK